MSAHYWDEIVHVLIVLLYVILSGLWIRIHFLRIQIQSLMLETNTDPDPDPIQIQGLNDQKLKKKLQLKNLVFLFWSKTAIYLSLGLHKVCPTYRRSLQFSKEAIQHFKTWTFTNFFLLLWVIFALLDPDPDSEYGSGSTGPDWIRIQSGSGSETLYKTKIDLKL